jgi:hypothetical protein
MTAPSDKNKTCQICGCANRHDPGCANNPFRAQATPMTVTYVAAADRPELTGLEPEVEARIRALRHARAEFISDGNKVVIQR